MGKTGETCGAVSGALMIIGLKYGARDEGDRIAKDKTYEQAEAFLNEFKARNGSLICRELIGFQIGRNNGPEKNAVIAQRCPVFVKNAAEILEKILDAEIQKSGGPQKRAHSG